MKMTLGRWNGIIDDVNAVTGNPPEGCDPIAPIPHVANRTVWAKSHFRAIYSAIQATCPDIEFKADLSKSGRESWIREIYERLADAWCKDCDDDDCQGEEGTQILLLHLTPEITITCDGSAPEFRAPLRGFVDGLQVAAAGRIGRTWGVNRVDSDGTAIGIDGGQIGCDGKALYDGTAQIFTKTGILVICQPCGNDSCDEAIRNAQDALPRVPSVDYVMTIFATGAECVEECP